MQDSKQNLDKFKDTLIESVNNITETGKKDNWIFSYDKISDILYLAPKDKSFSKDSFMVPIAEDSLLSFRLNRTGKVEGMIIESFVKLFVPDNKEFRRLSWALRIKPSKTLGLEGYRLNFDSLLSKSFKLFGKNFIPSCVLAAA